MEQSKNYHKIFIDSLKETEPTLNEKLCNFITLNTKEIGDRIRKTKNKAITCKDVYYKSSDRYYALPLGLHFTHRGISFYGVAYAAIFKDRDEKQYAVIWYSMAKGYIFYLLNTHAISRYRKRQLKKEQLPFFKVILELMAREFPAVMCGDVRIDKLKPYGNKKAYSQQFRSKNGVFLGYGTSDSDNETWIFHLQTFLTEDMVRKSYPLLSIENKEVADYIKYITMMRSGNPRGLAEDIDVLFGIASDGTNSILLSGDNLTQYREKAREEYESMSGKKLEEFLENQDLLRQENIQKYYNKLKRKGYT